MPLEKDAGAASRSLVYLHQAQVRRKGRTALRDITFSLDQGENWLVLGPNGSGKSTFLSLLRGDIWPVGTGNHPRRQFQVDGRWQISPLGWRERTAHISPELEQYVRRLPRIQSCAEIIGSGGSDSFCLPGRNDLRANREVQRLAGDFGLTAVLDQPFALLSQGEAQKALLARAIMARPQVLFLDEPFTGLDQSTRQYLLNVLHGLKSKGVQIITATHRPDDLACCMDRAVVLAEGTIAWQGRVQDLPSPAQNTTQSLQPPSQPCQDTQQPCIRLEQAQVSFHGRPVLGPITLTVHRGEHWRIQGPNGSGKTTLLKLLAGEVHPCLGGRVLRFPPVHSRSLQGLRQKIGLFSPELATFHRRSQSGLQTVLSGLRGHFGVRGSFSQSEYQQALAWMKSLGLADLADRDILGLSSGQLRRLLLARAVVHEPSLLLVDEPCAGLDVFSRMKLLQTLENLAGQQVQIIMVNHRPEESFPALTRTLTLNQGQVADIH